MHKLSEVLNMYKSEHIDGFLKKNYQMDLNENKIKESAIKKNWMFIGGNVSNASSINIIQEGEKGIIERLSNAIDAVLEKERERLNITNPKTYNTIVKKAFPKYFDNCSEITSASISNRPDLHAKDAQNKVMLVVHDGSSTNKPTLDIIDKGIGIKGSEFYKTILSLQGGNKINLEKSYLIGTFGQGGSTSLSFAYATIIVSKFADAYYFTIVKKVQLEEYKNHSYVYLVQDEQIQILEDDLAKNEGIKEDFIKEFVKAESGTYIRMIETDINREYRKNDITKPGMLNDYINTELFRVALPVKLIENRKNFTDNVHAQTRYSYGSHLKLLTWKYVKNEYCGDIEFEHNGRTFQAHYYIILPPDENLWAKDSECKDVFKRFNVHEEPIIFTVNGQYINGVYFTKIKNAGLGYLQYRLLIEIDLDNLGSEKYDFFTSDRSKIKNSDITKGFVDKIVKVVSSQEKLHEINQIIGDKSLATAVSDELIKDIEKEVKGLYEDFLKSGSPGKDPGKRPGPGGSSEEIYYDVIKGLKITNARNTFKKNENVHIILQTEATKSVNKDAGISCFVDENAYYDYTPAYMNGRIQYSLNTLSIGQHSVKFGLYDHSEILESDVFDFEILDQDSDTQTESKRKALDIKINPVDGKELIVDISKNEMLKVITINLCLSNPIAEGIFKGHTADKISELKTKMIKPLCLYALTLQETYDELPDTDTKNKFVHSFMRALKETVM